MLVDQATAIIARHRKHDPAKCMPGKCTCMAAAIDVILLLQEYHAAERNQLAEMLADRTDELQRLKRLVGEEA